MGCPGIRHERLEGIMPYMAEKRVVGRRLASRPIMVIPTSSSWTIREVPSASMNPYATRRFWMAFRADAAASSIFLDSSFSGYF
jgi:hypothetical protein